MFSDFVIAYLFLGGAGGGALVVLSLLEWASPFRRATRRRVNPGTSFIPVPKKTSHQSPLALPDEVLRCGWAITVVFLVLGALFLFLDLGRPERVVGLLLHPTMSAICVGAYSLLVAISVSSVFAASYLIDGFALSRRAISLLSFLGVLCGCVLATYTGVLLAQTASVLFWMTPLLPVLFVLSSLSSGIAVVMMGAAFANTRQAFDKVLVRLGNVDFVLIVLEFAVLGAWLVWGVLNQGPSPSALALLTGDISVIFWVGLVICGMLLPLFLEQYLSYGNHKTQTLMIAGLLLFGAVLLRWCVVQAGSFDVTQTQLMDCSIGGILLSV